MKNIKKMLTSAGASALAASMAFGALSFVVPPAKDPSKQVSICSTMVVDVKTGATGIRSYAQMVDSTQIYKAGDLITIATTIEVKNRAKNPTLATIEDSDIDLVVKSSTADLSYAGISPVVLSAVIGTNMWGQTSNVATIATRIMTSALRFDRPGDQLFLHMVGAKDEGTIDGSALQFYVPREGQDKAGNSALLIPAVNAADYNTSMGVIAAPAAVQYTLVVSAIAKAAVTGEIEAKLMVKSGEAFYNASTKHYDKVFGEGNTPNASMRVLNVGNQYTIVRNYDDKKNNRVGLSEYLETAGWPLGDRADKLAYRGEKGTLELYRVFKYDDGAIDGMNPDKFIIGLVTEASGDPTARIKGLGMTTWMPNDEVIRMQTGGYRFTGVGKNDGSTYANDTDIKTPSNMSASDIDNALNYFKLTLGINAGGGVAENDFAKLGAGPSYSNSVKNTYRYGTITIIEDTVDEETEEEIIEEEELEEEESEDLVPEEEEETEEIPEETPIPQTGDVPAIAMASALLLLGASATIVVLVKRKKGSK